MRILVASHTYIVDLNREKWRSLAQLNSEMEVTVVVPKRWRPGGVQKQIIEPEYLEEGSFRVVPIANFSENNQGLLAFGAGLIGLLRKFRPHILQAEQGVKSLAYAELITLNRFLRLQAKNVFFTWWNLPYQLRWPVTALEAYNLRHSDGIIAGNQDGADILRQRGYQGPISVMPQLGVDEQIFQPQPQTELARSLGITPNDFIVGFVGRFVPEKGLMTLAKALAGLREYPWKWLLVGRGEQQEQLQNWAAQNQLSDRLIWVESVPHDEVPHYMNLINALVLPSETTYEFQTLTSAGWKEQFGHVLIEAMACKVPIIGSDCGEIPHAVGDAGLIFPEQNVSALQNCLQRLFEEPQLVQDLAQKGYERAMNQYTNHALAKRTLAFYRTLV
jgi:glycosyltransferase involved in cell wall biosynthesis